MLNFNSNDTMEKNFSEKDKAYYTTKETALMLNVKECTVRYWSEQFKEFIEVERVGRNRRFTEENIKVLDKVKRLLRDDNYSISKVAEHLAKEKLVGLVDSNEEILNEVAIDEIFANEPLRDLIAIKEDIILEIRKVIEQLEQQKEEIAFIKNDLNKCLPITVDDNSLISITDINDLNVNRAERRKRSESRKKKGFFKKIFSK